jgi:cytochrome c-type biogenesis protein CcmE
MNRKKLRIAFGIVVILIVLIFFAVSGFQEGKAYYKTLEELGEMGTAALGKRIKVAGRVAAGSIKGTGRALTFTLEQNEVTLPVRYTGSSPVPDTFKDGTEAVVEGRYLEEGIFEADKIQAKCASKYEAEYGTSDPESS